MQRREKMSVAKVLARRVTVIELAANQCQAFGPLKSLGEGNSRAPTMDAHTRSRAMGLCTRRPFPPFPLLSRS